MAKALMQQSNVTKNNFTKPIPKTTPHHQFKGPFFVQTNNFVSLFISRVH